MSVGFSGKQVLRSQKCKRWKRGMMPMKGKERGSRIQQGAPQTEMQIKSWAIHWGTPEQSHPWEEFPLGRNVQTPHAALSLFQKLSQTLKSTTVR